MKEFTRLNNKTCCSGFDYSKWPKRNVIDHREHANEHLLANHRSKQEEIERNYGVRYSVLLELPYFDPIRMAVVDPMHNLFLGTAKFVMQFWIENDILTKNDLLSIEQTVSQHKAPRSSGRLPTKISSGFAGFSADQWRNWTTVYSNIALQPVLPSQHLQYWLLFVKACKLLCTRTITTSNIEQAHQYLKLFCTKFESVNGHEVCTPNMHLHLHLSECLLDYGPLYGFWCYSFERYNGTLGKYPTNQKQIESQLMKKCILDQSLRSHKSLDESPFQSLLSKKEQTGGCLLSASPDVVSSTGKLSSPKISLGLLVTTGLEKLIPPKREKVLECHLSKQLQELYTVLYPHHTIEHFSQFYRSSSRASFCDQVLGSVQFASERSSVVAAYWPVVADTTIEHHDTLPLSIGQVQFYIEHAVTLKENTQIIKELHYFAYVNWYMRHDQWDSYGSNCIISYPTQHTPSLFSFIPFSRIHSICAHGDHIITLGRITDKVFIATPIPFY